MTSVKTAPTEHRPLRHLCFALIGGEAGCPRRRFFSHMLVVAVLLHLCTPAFFGAFLPQQGRVPLLPEVNMGDIAFALVTMLSALLGTFSGGPFLEVLSCLSSVADLSVRFSSPALNIYLCGGVVLLSGVVTFLLACRRLQDAGRSRWNLLAGVTYFLWPAVLPFGGAVLYYVLCNLGGLWLLYLYSRPSRRMSFPRPHEDVSS